jgi:hypothetical protein
MADANSPMFRAFCGFRPFFYAYKSVPMMDVRIPVAARNSGRYTPFSPPKLHSLFRPKSDKYGTQYHGTDNRAHIRFKKVGTHTGHVAHVIAHVIGDGGRVQRVVFRNTGFHFTHKVGTHIGCFGVNTAAYPCKKRNGRGSERKACYDGDYLLNFRSAADASMHRTD